MEFDGFGIDILERSARMLFAIEDSTIDPVQKRLTAAIQGIALCDEVIAMECIDPVAVKFDYIPRLVGSGLKSSILFATSDFYATDFYPWLKDLQKAPDGEAGFIGVSVLAGLITSVILLDDKKRKTKMDKRVLNKLYGSAIDLGYCWRRADIRPLIAFHKIAKNDTIYFRTLGNAQGFRKAIQIEGGHDGVE
jgi:hypothetical protein